MSSRSEPPASRGEAASLPTAASAVASGPHAGVLEAAVGFAQRFPARWLLVYLVVTAALYQTAIRLPLYSPFVVEPTAFDAWIPVVPETAALYLTYFLLMPSWVWLLCRPSERAPERGRWIMAAGLVVVGNLTLNILVPTELASPLRPEEAGGWLLAQVISGDAPRAALPSGHLALPLALAVLAFRARLGARWIYVAWAAMMAVVILTTKQHYLPDALGALVWGSLGPLLTMRLVGLPPARSRP